MDILSLLPDELQVLIISFLTLKESVATSILSRRWRYLWTFTPRLEFDDTDSLWKVNTSKRWNLMLRLVRRNFIRWVDHVISSSHKNSILESFRVCFNLTSAYTSFINEWLMYALARKVQILELDLTYDGSFNVWTDAHFYSFPGDPITLTHFKHLKKIYVRNVNVSGLVLELLVCNYCPLLEDLSVYNSIGLSALKIDKPFAAFKRLEIIHCDNLVSMEIRDANLVYLKYGGEVGIHFVLWNVPMLVEICAISHKTRGLLTMFSSVLAQLVKLQICIQRKFSWQEANLIYSAVKMSNLKQLVVRIYIWDDNSLLPLTKLIQASPSLQRFDLELL
ncbi:F-box protein at3g03040 [Phtheirospermum japonicum]|uniref:F-box protein at3g03040 n=1 Tax=Phtheirospermum japonicum TaxID=374723 RepID=A0A830D323_9LAMI|nr:F-box protein at3g03040 [Phtheirospermum japonicum]